MPAAAYLPDPDKWIRTTPASSSKAKPKPRPLTTIRNASATPPTTARRASKSTDRSSRESRPTQGNLDAFLTPLTAPRSRVQRLKGAELTKSPMESGRADSDRSGVRRSLPRSYVRDRTSKSPDKLAREHSPIPREPSRTELVLRQLKSYSSGSAGWSPVKSTKDAPDASDTETEGTDDGYTPPEHSPRLLTQPPLRALASIWRMNGMSRDDLQPGEEPWGKSKGYRENEARRRELSRGERERQGEGEVKAKRGFEAGKDAPGKDAERTTRRDGERRRDGARHGQGLKEPVGRRRVESGRENAEYTRREGRSDLSKSAKEPVIGMRRVEPGRENAEYTRGREGDQPRVHSAKEPTGRRSGRDAEHSRRERFSTPEPQRKIIPVDRADAVVYDDGDVQVRRIPRGPLSPIGVNARPKRHLEEPTEPGTKRRFTSPRRNIDQRVQALYQAGSPRSRSRVIPSPVREPREPPRAIPREPREPREAPREPREAPREPPRQSPREPSREPPRPVTPLSNQPPANAVFALPALPSSSPTKAHPSSDTDTGSVKSEQRPRLFKAVDVVETLMTWSMGGDAPARPEPMPVQSGGGGDGTDTQSLAPTNASQSFPQFLPSSPSSGSGSATPQRPAIAPTSRWAHLIEANQSASKKKRPDARPRLSTDAGDTGKQAKLQAFGIVRERKRKVGKGDGFDIGFEEEEDVEEDDEMGPTLRESARGLRVTDEVPLHPDFRPAGVRAVRERERREEEEGRESAGLDKAVEGQRVEEDVEVLFSPRHDARASQSLSELDMSFSSFSTSTDCELSEGEEGGDGVGGVRVSKETRAWWDRLGQGE